MATKLQMVPRRIWLLRSEKSGICKDIELNFGIDTKFVPLSSKTNINLQL